MNLESGVLLTLCEWSFPTLAPWDGGGGVGEERLSKVFNKRKNQMSHKSYNTSLIAKPVPPGHDGPDATALMLEQQDSAAPG